MPPIPPRSVDQAFQQRRQALLRSLHEPHPDSTATAAVGIQAWAESLPAGDDDLLDPDAGVTVRWRSVQGWQETE